MLHANWRSLPGCCYATRLNTQQRLCRDFGPNYHVEWRESQKQETSKSVSCCALNILLHLTVSQYVQREGLSLVGFFEKSQGWFQKVDRFGNVWTTGGVLRAFMVNLCWELPSGSDSFSVILLTDRHSQGEKISANAAPWFHDFLLGSRDTRPIVLVKVCPVACV